MSDCVWLLRHGATEWTDDGRHTGREDVPLSETGREQARHAGELLVPRRFEHVPVSPQSRAVETCQLAGFGDRLKPAAELVEWDYGEYEGLTDQQTQERHPGWDLFCDGCPGGETPEQVATRVDRLLVTVGEFDDACLLVAHGKLLRALAARWLGCSVALGGVLAMDPAAICCWNAHLRVRCCGSGTTPSRCRPAPAYRRNGRPKRPPDRQRSPMHRPSSHGGASPSRGCGEVIPASPNHLCERCGADLLVLGSRGRGGFRGLQLGSVSGERAARRRQRKRGGLTTA